MTSIDIQPKRISRRTFVRFSGVLAAGALLDAACTRSASTAVVPTSANNDLQIYTLTPTATLVDATKAVAEAQLTVAADVIDDKNATIAAMASDTATNTATATDTRTATATASATRTETPDVTNTPTATETPVLLILGLSKTADR